VAQAIKTIQQVPLFVNFDYKSKQCFVNSKLPAQNSVWGNGTYIRKL